MSDYSEEDWRKWGNQFGWEYEESPTPTDGAYFLVPWVGHKTPFLSFVAAEQRQAIDSLLSSKDSLIAELTKERDDTLALVAMLDGEQAARIKAEAELAAMKDRMEG